MRSISIACRSTKSFRERLTDARASSPCKVYAAARCPSPQAEDSYAAQMRPGALGRRTPELRRALWRGVSRCVAGITVTHIELAAIERTHAKRRFAALPQLEM